MDFARNENAFLFPYRFHSGGQLSELIMRECQLLLCSFALGNVEKHHHGSGDPFLFDDGK
jgi:hypothetical protein